MTISISPTLQDIGEHVAAHIGAISGMECYYNVYDPDSPPHAELRLLNKVDSGVISRTYTQTQDKATFLCNLFYSATFRGEGAMAAADLTSATLSVKGGQGYRARVSSEVRDLSRISARGYPDELAQIDLGVEMGRSIIDTDYDFATRLSVKLVLDEIQSEFSAAQS